MFGWRRRSEGFEWKEYVRTTVLVRRRDRQRRIDEAREAAIARVHDAKERGIEAGRSSVGAVSGVVGNVARFTGGVIAQAAGAIWHGIVEVATALISLLGERLPAKPDLGDAPRAARADYQPREHEATARRAYYEGIKPERPKGPIRADSVVERIERAERQARAEAELLPDVEPRMFRFPEIKLPGNLPFKASHVLAAAAGLAIIYFGGSILRGEPDFTIRAAPSLAAKTVTLEPVDIVGRATAVTGDLVRVNGTLLRLAGVEAPEADQPCFKPNGRRWSCSASARSALERLLRGTTVRCVPNGHDQAGRQLATCKARGADIGAELVRRGDVFAASGLFARYGGDEEEAKAAGTGVWQGDVVRPQEWRDQTWEEAKRNAPDGCPIKGIARASSSTYVMPWTRGYANKTPRPDRGDRWFCSESEARDAGFLPADGA